MNFKFVLYFIACIGIIIAFGKRFLFPVRKILKLVFNSCMGLLIIFVINLVGQSFDFHIGLNFINSVIVGLLGIPGAGLLIILQIFCGL